MASDSIVVAAMPMVPDPIEHKGLFCAVYSARGSYFWLTPGRQGRAAPADAVGAVLSDLGVQMPPV